MAKRLKHVKTSHETRDDGEDKETQQTQICAKDSLDRFDDNLCGRVLSYLSLEDRSQCECVSKQFQRTVFASVVDMTLNDRFIHRLLDVKRSDTEMLTTFPETLTTFLEKCQFLDRLHEYNVKRSDVNTLAIKCPNIQTIDCRRITRGYGLHIPEVVDIFRRHCHHLRDIYTDLWAFSEQTMCSLGPLVTRIGDIKHMSKSLTHCNRLTELRVFTLDYVFDCSDDQLMAKNLRKFEVKNYLPLPKNLDKLSAFVTHNQCLQSVVFGHTLDITRESIGQMCGQLSRLPQLRELGLTFMLRNADNSLKYCLRTIGENCKQLHRLSLTVVSMSAEPKTPILYSLRFYGQLKRLQLTLLGAVANDVLNPLKHCKSLTHLELYSTEVNPKLLKHFKDKYLRLEFLCIRCYVISGKCLSLISRLPALKMLVIHYQRNDGFRDNDFTDLLSSSTKLKTIEIIENNVKKLYTK